MTPFNDPIYMRVCLICLSNPCLKELLSNDSEQDNCSFCGKRRKTVAVCEVADCIAEGLETAYQHGEPDYQRSMGGHEGGDLYTIISEEVGCYTEVSEAIAETLFDGRGRSWDQDEFCFFDREVLFVRCHHVEALLHHHWEEFSNQIKNRSRFYGPIRKFLSDLFSEGEGSPFNQGYPEFVIEPDDSQLLYRARIAHGLDEAEKFIIKPHKELSFNSENPPAGRMNAFGVPVFYCALSSETAIKEVRPSIGSYVVVGKFSAVRLLKLLDLTRAGKIDPGGIFSPGYKARKEKLGFLASFDSIVSQPIRPHREALEYLPTQMVAEYIQHELGYDGVVYSSAQESDGGEPMKKNIALFGCADWRVKNIGESETDKDSESDWLFENDPWLKIASDNVSVHSVRQINFETPEITLAIQHAKYCSGADPDDL